MFWSSIYFTLCREDFWFWFLFIFTFSRERKFFYDRLSNTEQEKEGIRSWEWKGHQSILGVTLWRRECQLSIIAVSWIKQTVIQKCARVRYKLSYLARAVLRLPGFQVKTAHLQSELVHWTDRKFRSEIMSTWQHESTSLLQLCNQRLRNRERSSNQNQGDSSSLLLNTYGRLIKCPEQGLYNLIYVYIMFDDDRFSIYYDNYWHFYSGLTYSFLNNIFMLFILFWLQAPPWKSKVFRMFECC